MALPLPIRPGQASKAGRMMSPSNWHAPPAPCRNHVTVPVTTTPSSSQTYVVVPPGALRDLYRATRPHRESLVLCCAVSAGRPRRSADPCPGPNIRSAYSVAVVAPQLRSSPSSPSWTACSPPLGTPKPNPRLPASPHAQPVSLRVGELSAGHPWGSAYEGSRATVAAPFVAPPVSPVPAVTLVMSPADSLICLSLAVQVASGALPCLTS